LLSFSIVLIIGQNNDDYGKLSAFTMHPAMAGRGGHPCPAGRLPGCGCAGAGSLTDFAAEAKKSVHLHPDLIKKVIWQQ
jgi:hypothetical protein